MNKISVVALCGLALTVSACSDKPQKTALKCHSDAEVTVNHAAASLNARPELRKVCLGGTLTLKFVPRVGSGKAHTNPGKGSSDKANWLGGSTNSRGEIVLQVPEDALAPDEDEKDYKYDIIVDGVGTLDPRARVVR